MPVTVSKKCIFADHLALLRCDNKFKFIETVLSTDSYILRDYFRRWRLKLNTNKTVRSTFHLSNRLADYELTVNTNGIKIPFEKTPKYLGVTLDRTLSFKQNLTDTAAKTSSRCSLLKILTGSKWSADFTTLRTSALGLCFSVAEYCSPVWGNSAHALN